MFNAENAPCLMLVERQTKILPRCERNVLVSANTRDLVRIGILLQWDSTQPRTIRSGIIDALLNSPFNILFINPNNAPSSLTKYQLVAAELHAPPAIIHSKCDEPSLCISNYPVYDSVNLVHHQPRAERLQ